MQKIKKLFLLAFKKEMVLEVWIELESGERLKKISYPFTAFSGSLGPKLCEGDKQIPEGIYQIEYLNPNSKYHLSIKLNYPNDFDKKKSILDNRLNPGSDIFIHGGAESVGCIAIGDEAIEQLYALVSDIGKESVTVCIAPIDFRVTEVEELINPNFPVWVNELYDSLKLFLKQFKTIN
ncbi:MAG: L,D-transpeptidase family protein [Flavobacteriales bacterium]|nr:L,D-transpeptidase family protein [Flavobacteriales bacterium]